MQSPLSEVPVEGEGLLRAFPLHQREGGRIHVAPVLVAMRNQDRPSELLDRLIDSYQLDNLPRPKSASPGDRLRAA